MPQELTGLASGIALNFPWGSLLEGLLSADPALFQALERAAGRRASLEVRLNAGALAEAGITLQAGADQIHSNLLRSGWMASSPRLMEIPAMRTFPSTWARRLAHGRDPRALEIHAQRVHHAFRS